VVEYREEIRSHWALTQDRSGAVGTCAPGQLPSGQVLHKPASFLKQLNDEYARLEGKRKPQRRIGSFYSLGACVPTLSRAGLGLSKNAWIARKEIQTIHLYKIVVCRRNSIDPIVDHARQMERVVREQ
jgi:hypothetical protein